jgi:hypothetical protein
MTRTIPDRTAAAAIVRAALLDSEIEFEESEDGLFIASLPGTRRLKTSCWLAVGNNALTIEAFVMRAPDENVEAVYRWLLAHNHRMYGVAWAIDDAGDVYLNGRWPLAAVEPDALDRLLGSVLDYADSSFNALLELGFGSSIRREWAWRESRGESLANLAAFEGFVRRTSEDG